MKTAEEIIDDILLNQPMQKDGETLEDFCERSEQRRINILTTWKEDICKKQKLESAKNIKSICERINDEMGFPIVEELIKAIKTAPEPT